MKLCVLAVSLIALAGPALAAEPAPPSTSSQAACPGAAPTQTKGPAVQPGPQRLDQLPAGHLELAVVRSIGGCAVASVKEGDQVRYVPIPQAQRMAVPAGFVPRQR